MYISRYLADNKYQDLSIHSHLKMPAQLWSIYTRGKINEMGKYGKLSIKLLNRYQIPFQNSHRKREACFFSHKL